jgi:hypothetical protein
MRTSRGRRTAVLRSGSVVAVAGCGSASGGPAAPTVHAGDAPPPTVATASTSAGALTAAATSPGQASAPIIPDAPTNVHIGISVTLRAGSIEASGAFNPAAVRLTCTGYPDGKCHASAMLERLTARGWVELSSTSSGPAMPGASATYDLYAPAIRPPFVVRALLGGVATRAVRVATATG